ncbi:MAG: bifunctional (p)ppGpp synthetase/guanosine-3',5'-bis(diphosphate) 3'-pyrophosphohydrolase [Clostridia bacterium]|nr:bifunctional (p)ppGpp synthetase/guanosine-3',5'-bis(diphosphate) 3'-pyrophosphohydrolase [Clostridia bacterium]
MKKEKAEVTISNLKSKIKHYYPGEYTKILDAFELAQKAHATQKRASGRPYITHPVVVADILVDLGLDVPVICAGLLHDTVEDTYVTDELLRTTFGDEIADLVKGVTKLDKIQFVSKEQEQAENIRKMFFAMSKDIRVLIIKLADRLHNMRSLQYLSEERQQIMARETMDIYAPLAGRLGISAIKCELEDLSLKFLDREAYDNISELIAAKKEERQVFIDETIVKISNALKENNVNFDIVGRTKHFYSIYKKMKTQGKAFEQIYDLMAIRVIVTSKEECYLVLGILHQLWTPLPGRVKDYIASPKPNLYQSLHTTLISDNGTPVEIQIRTKNMNRIAEFGIAAHWKYKEGNTNKGLDSELKWVQDVLSYQGDLQDSGEFLDIIRHDIKVTNEIFVFTPKGDVRKLIKGATTLDFAYAIHSEIGNKCAGSKVNGRIVSLDTELDTGDVVEILINNNSKGPGRDWLKIVKTSGARAKIRQFFKRELKEENIKNGKTMLEKEASHKGYVLSQLLTDEALKNVLERYSFTNVDEMYASVGYGGVTINQVLMKLIGIRKSGEGLQLPVKQYTSKAVENPTGVRVKGYESPLIRFSKCCSPVPGDDIVGYISYGRGVTIHRADCVSLKGLQQYRLVEASWEIDEASEAGATYIATIIIRSEDKGEVFADITRIVSSEGLTLTAINAKKDKSHVAIAQISVEIRNHTQLESLMAKLRALPHTLEVQRTSM